MIVEKIFDIKEYKERFTDHQIYLLERTITMLIEIGINSLEPYELLYDDAIYELGLPLDPNIDGKEKEELANKHFNALGIIRCFWAYFEFDSETRKLIEKFLNHEDLAIRNIAKRILED